MRKKDPNQYPTGLNKRKVRDTIAHYDRHTEAEAIIEANIACENSRLTLMRVPTELVPEVERLIEKHSQNGGRGRKIPWLSGRVTPHPAHHRFVRIN